MAAHRLHRRRHSPLFKLFSGHGHGHGHGHGRRSPLSHSRSISLVFLAACCISILPPATSSPRHASTAITTARPPRDLLATLDHYPSSELLTTTDDLQALLSIKQSISSDPRGILSSWSLANNSSRDPFGYSFCYWNGVYCQDGRVSRLDLSGYDLNGRLSPAISGLRFLMYLDLSCNSFRQSIPPQLGNLSSLSFLNLSFNAFTGPIPTSISSCSRLSRLDLSHNLLDGTIPSQFSGLTSLETINLSFNKLSGTIPRSLSLCPNLAIIRLDGNGFIGAIPEEFGAMPKLSVFSASSNRLSGGMPSTMQASRAFVEIDLSANGLSGPISSFGASLQIFNISANGFSGLVPQPLSDCLDLLVLDISRNGFSGPVPPSLANCPRLLVLDVSENRLTGTIPNAILGLQQLKILELSGNKLMGPIPREVGSIRSLLILDLARNALSGRIPAELGQLSSLQVLDISMNSLNGPIPSSLGNLHFLYSLCLYGNNLTGSLPPTLVNFPLLETLDLHGNHLEGPLNEWIITNWTFLKTLDLSFNSFTGGIPSQIGDILSHIQRINLGHNFFNGSIPPSLGNCTSLYWLDISECDLMGPIPETIGQLRSLQHLNFENNGIIGIIPPSLGQLTSLRTLYLGSNKLVGPIFDDIGNLSLLEELHLFQNGLSGPIPTGIGQCVRLTKIWLGYNQLNSSIPASLAGLTLLEFFSIHSNLITGEIPFGLLTSSHLLYLDLSMNTLTGHIPDKFENLGLIQTIDLSWNRLGGIIPSNIGKYCKQLVALNLSNNMLEGPIPPELGNITNLTYFSVANNNLEGPVPTWGSLARMNASAFSGNPLLCGVIIGVACEDDDDGPNTPPSLPMRPEERPGGAARLRSQTKVVIASAICSAAVGAAFTICIWWWCYLLYRKPKFDTRTASDRWPTTRILSFDAHLKLTLTDLWVATEGFESKNIVAFGKVFTLYRGELRQDGKVIAIKRVSLPTLLEEQTKDKLLEEISVLAKAKHKNVMPFICCCFSGDTLALVQDFMPRGSLEDHLYAVGKVGAKMPIATNEDELLFGPQGHLVMSPTKGCDLRWEVRLKIICGVADGMVFLHEQGGLVHGNLKPSNILLDGNLEPRVCDFAIMEILSSYVDLPLNSSHGSYVAPECRSTKKSASTQSDVYSFGVVVLQMLTVHRSETCAIVVGVAPGPHGLARWVRSNFPDRVTMMLDPILQEEAPSHREEVVQVMALALHCTQEDPNDRPTMVEVCSSLRRIQSHDRTSTRFFAPLDVILDRSSGSNSYATLSNPDASFGALPTRREDEESLLFAKSMKLNSSKFGNFKPPSFHNVRVPSFGNMRVSSFGNARISSFNM